MEDLRINSEEFNGWNNRETWAAMLYISNDQGLNDEAAARLAGAFNYGRIDGETVADRRASGISRATKSLEDWIESLFTRAGYIEEFGGDIWPAVLADMASDIGSLYRINYREIAEAILEDTLASFDAEPNNQTEAVA
jgi:hypothetical protein